ncbi:indole-3-glycerol phosphate synthase TrpC [Dehalococcoidia bacterium]|nr:indole-3-glycerol phosphate synthase TrpC [Dehalococcoidia bacterium]
MSVFLKLGQSPPTFLLESVERGENLGRYSFMGLGHSLMLESKGNRAVIHNGSTDQEISLEDGDPLHLIQEIMTRRAAVRMPELPPFCGGAVGYLAYDIAEFFEELPQCSHDELDLPDCFFLFADTLLAFDHVQHKMKIIANAYVDDDVDAAYHKAISRVCRYGTVKVPELMGVEKYSHVSHIVSAVEGRLNPGEDAFSLLRASFLKLIAEVKRASPSKGLLAPNIDAATFARTYEEAGAAAVSVLTESEYFRGSLTDLESVRAAVGLPILRKDFILDPYQVYEARAHGADAVLLIVGILSPVELRSLLETTHSLGMTALVEIHDREELEQVLAIDPEIIGINNRNLADFGVSLETTVQLRLLVPGLVVSESGIHTRDDVVKLEDAGVDAILVGEALVSSPDPARKIRELLG